MRNRSMNSHDYWLMREQNNLKHYEAQEKGYSKKVDAIYQSMIDECNRAIEGFYARYAKKEGITLAEAKKRAANLDIKAYERKAKKYVREKNFSDQANEEMRIYNMTMKVNRLELLKSELSLEMVAGADATDKYYQQIFTDRAIEEYKRQAGILGLTVPDDEILEEMADNIVHGSFQNPTIDGSYTTFSERIWVNQDALRSEVLTELTRGLIKGLNPRELAKSLDKKMQAGRYNAERLMRTELARVQTGVQQQAISEAGYDEYMFIATESGHTCSICRALDGKVFKLKKMQIGTNAAPMHPHCRCSCAAAMSDEEFKELTGVDPVHLDLKAINAEAVAKYKTESKNKSVELPEELRSTKAIDESIKNGIRDAIDGIEKNYGYRIPEIEYAPYTDNEKAPFTYIPYQEHGIYKAKLNINTLFDWNETLESFNNRIYNKNYKTGVLASKNIDDLIFHETAHFKTFESCRTWGDFLQKEREVRNRYIPGISAYNDSMLDGAETIAEGMVAMRNGEIVSQEISNLIKEYIRW